MFKLATLIAAALVVAPVAFAQDTGSIPPCILNCTTTSLAAGGCTGITDLQCICTSTDFQTAAGTCIATDCPDQTDAALTLQNEQCAAITGSESVSGGASSTGSGTGSASSTRSTTRSGSSTAAPSGSSASASASTTSRPNAGFHTAGIASGVTLAIFGAALSLF
ncbi:hypothetical protein M408DRAFT_288137 [Serendipita vermifera MAFF 305830]|uniref:CFEM domain-containing protein n=1 Tax=Serendipita vermifera MAFF 305830 TaxID=933852 RepID=A0A0C2XNT5_SERVB|nr:hypothetical protein M408DRAFT_288137 [Serendipita vermifera MAFF 305830]